MSKDQIHLWRPEAQRIGEMASQTKSSRQNRSHSLIFSAAAAVHRDTASLRRTAKFLLRAYVNPAATLRWLRFIEAASALAQAPFHVRRVLTDKIHRAFAAKAFGTAARVECLINHYQILLAVLPGAAAGLIAGERITLATLDGTAGRYLVTISREMLSQHQGELTILFIEPAKNIALARLPLNLGHGPNGPRLTIAGLQGPPPEHKDKIIAATRDLDGLRPKRIVLEAAIAIAGWLAADQVVATAKQNHVSQRLGKWRRKIHADYDSFWQEFAPAQNSDGDFLLPVPPPRASFEGLPAKKRKPRERRYQRLDDLTASTADILSRLARS